MVLYKASSKITNILEHNSQNNIRTNFLILIESNNSCQKDVILLRNEQRMSISYTFPFRKQKELKQTSFKIDTLDYDSVLRFIKQRTK